MNSVDSVQPSRCRKWIRRAGRCLLALAGLYLLLLVPDRKPPMPEGARQKSFAWNRPAFWTALEARFRDAQLLTPADRLARFNQALEQFNRALDGLKQPGLPPNAPVFDELENRIFQLAPLAAVCPEGVPDFSDAVARARRLVKWQSEKWSMDSPEARERLYRLLYGGRAALEEAMLQSPGLTNALEVYAADDSPAAPTPAAEVRGVNVHSGDILLSRGNAATSALIARGNDFPGNFSHVALACVDPQTRRVSVVESHIESGVEVSPIEDYLAGAKLRIVLLRLRGDLPPLIADPLLPHRAASLALSNALARHIPYDFEMNYADPAKQFCSEVASAAYRPFGITLWMGRSHLSTPGVTSWLGTLGVRYFETQEPSDLEYDPQIRVVAEWRDPEALFRDHVDNAVIDVMLQEAERGAKLDYNLWLLPPARLAKAWSVLLNRFGKVGPIPEGMSATTALRAERLKADHAALKARLLEQVTKFRTERGYVPPYWELVRLAREVQAK